MSQSESIASPGMRVRNRRGEGALLRQDILRAAHELLDESGTSAAVTLRAVARRAGISPPSIYAHFAGPQEILLAVVADEFARLREHLRSSVDRRGSSPVDGLLALCDGYLDFAGEFPARYLLLFGGVWNAAEARTDAAIAPGEVEGLGVDLLEDIADLLTACVQDGSSSSDDPSLDATALWLGLHGLAHQRIVSTAFAWPSGIQQRLIQRLAHLEPRATSIPAKH